jgi:hypothetical protein
MVAAGLALVCSTRSKYTHFVIDLKDLSLKEKFICPRATAYPFQMPWPPAGLVPTYPCAGMSEFALSLLSAGLLLALESHIPITIAYGI